MANFDNSCSDLLVEDKYSQLTEEPLGALLRLQKNVQERVYGYDFNNLQESPLFYLREFFDWNYHAIQDELREIYDALGGIKDGISQDVWKNFLAKKNNSTFYSQMSENDKKELKMELIDCLHFLFNLMIASKLNPDYIAKTYMTDENSMLQVTVKSLEGSNKDLLKNLIDYQKLEQGKLSGYQSFFKYLQMGPMVNLKDFFDWNYHCIQNSLREVFEALGGAKHGIGNGVWKPWKKNHKQSQVMSLNTMTIEDIVNLQVKLIDCLKPLLNMMIAVEMDSQEIVNYYFSKNKENIERQKRGY